MSYNSFPFVAGQNEFCSLNYFFWY